MINEVHKNYCAKERNYQGDSNDKVNLAVGHTHSLAPNTLANDLAISGSAKHHRITLPLVVPPMTALWFDAVLGVKLVHGI